MMEKFELRFWDAVTPMLTSLQARVIHLRRPTARRLEAARAAWASITQTDQHTFLRLAVFSATTGFLTGSIFYLVLFTVSRL